MESGSLVKAFALLESLAGRGGQGPLGDLTLGVGLRKPTAHRILQSLIALGYVQRQSGGVYRLTPKLRWLAMNRSDRRLAAVAEPVLRKLRAETGETVNLGILRRNRVCYITVLESSHPLRRVVQPNQSDPVFTTALGRVLAAHLPAAQRERLLCAAPVERRTPKTVTDVSNLRRILVKIQQDGHAVERDQTDLGVTCIAAAVVVRGEPIAAISLSIPTARVSADAEGSGIAAVRASAVSLSRLMIHPRRLSA